MQEQVNYIWDGNVNIIGGTEMEQTNSVAINEWLKKTGKTLNDLPESLRGLLRKGVEDNKTNESCMARPSGGCGCKGGKQ